MSEGLHRILLLEDTEDHAELIRAAFAEAEEQRELVFAESLEAARREAARGVDLALVDLVLPDGSGIEFVREHGDRLPCMVMTSQGDEEIAVRAMKAGAIDYAVKSPRMFEALPLLATRTFEGFHRMRRLEAQLRHSQKMEAVGRLAGGIAHDFNNLLMGIVGCCRITRDQLMEERREEALGTLDQIIDAAERGARVTRKLLDFSRKGALNPSPLVVDEVIREAEPMLRHLLGEDVALRVELASAPCRIMADASQVEQALVNLAVNARDAMPQGGDLRILSRRVRGEAGGAAPAEDCVLVEVRDSGVGMDEATRSRIFEPFFTTKDEGKGTGLGLSSVFGVVSQLGGHVECTSAPGAGASFRLYFPVLAGEAADDAPAECAEAPTGGGETVLVVEDEFLVRLSVRHYLEGRGYTVLEAEDGRSGLAVAEERGWSLDLVVTDMVLPGGMSGREMVSRLRKLQPGVRVIYMSAYPTAVLQAQGRLEPGVPSLEKPFAAEEFLRLVREVLDG